MAHLCEAVLQATRVDHCPRGKTLHGSAGGKERSSEDAGQIDSGYEKGTGTPRTSGMKPGRNKEGAQRGRSRRTHHRDARLFLAVVAEGDKTVAKKVCARASCTKQ